MKKFIYSIIFIALLALVMIRMYCDVIEIGEKLRTTHQYLEFAFYALTIFVVISLIIYPLLSILFSPYYSISRFCDENDTNNGGIRSKARRLIKYGNLNDEEKEKIKECLKDRSASGKQKLSNRMYIVYNNQIKKNIDKLVADSAKDTLIMTAVSQSNFIDMIVVLVNNFRLIKKIVKMCGFRPTFIRTMKLFISVISSSLIADGIEKADLGSIVAPTLKGGTKLITESAMGGVINAFFMLRIGMLTKNYLYTEDPKKSKFSIRSNSYVEALKLYPSVISALITSPIKGIASLFKTDKNEPNEEVDISEPKWFRKKRNKPLD